MAAKTELRTNIAEASKKVVETKNYAIEVSCLTYADGTRSCRILDVVDDNPHKDLTPEVPGASSQQDATVAAVPLTPVDAIQPEKTPEKCNLCEAICDMLKEKVAAEAAAKAKLTAASRRIPTWNRPRRAVRS